MKEKMLFVPNIDDTEILRVTLTGKKQADDYLMTQEHGFLHRRYLYPLQAEEALIEILTERKKLRKAYEDSRGWVFQLRNAITRNEDPTGKSFVPKIETNPGIVEFQDAINLAQKIREESWTDKGLTGQPFYRVSMEGAAKEACEKTIGVDWSYAVYLLCQTAWNDAQDIVFKRLNFVPAQKPE